MLDRESGGGDHGRRAASILIVASALLAFGLVMVTSAAAPVQASLLDAPLWRTVFGRQLVFVLAGWGGMALTYLLAPAMLRRAGLRRVIAIGFLGVAIGLLLLTLVPGFAETRHGSQRWLRIGPAPLGIGFQPSELAKLGLVLFLVWWLADRDVDLRSWRKALLPACVVLGVLVALVGKEDFGTAILLATVGGAMLLVGGCRVGHLAVVGAAGFALLSVLLFAESYRLRRLVAFWDIWADPQGDGYQPLQSLGAIASGGWLGKGLGGGVQKYGYLPESHSDFIFAIVCEETGVVGGLLVLALFASIVVLGLQTMRSATTPQGRLLSFGLTSMVGLQAAMNVAVVSVVAPTTGISLPLVSAGGSGVLVSCMALGVLAALARDGQQVARVERAGVTRAAPCVADRIPGAVVSW